MTIRKEVEEFIRLGPLPDESVKPDHILKFQKALTAIIPPLTNEESRVLLKSFGPDSCFGLAWTLVHLIESAPTPCQLKSKPIPTDNSWEHTIWDRWINSQNNPNRQMN